MTAKEEGHTRSLLTLFFKEKMEWSSRALFEEDVLTGVIYGSQAENSHSILYIISDSTERR